jgi:DDE superfamily endonuclease/Tc5 transposase DNA-binding domain
MSSANQTREQTAELEKRVQEALDGVKTGTYTTIYQAALKLHLDPDILYRRTKGIEGRVAAHEDQQILSQAEERALVRWLTHLTASGYPARHSILRNMAVGLQTMRLAKINDESEELVSYPPIGKNWPTRFLNRHPQLKTMIVRAIEASRVKEVTRSAIVEWFEVFIKLIHENEITPENTYNMDETGFPLGTIQKAQVIVDSSIRMKCQSQPGRQEWITAVECVSADGTSIPPLIIFKGATLMNSWIPRDSPEGWKFSCSSSGWTSNVHGAEWLRRCFEPATREKANGQTRLLICDGHDSHITAQFLRHCLDNDILLILLRPHSSHLMQPLDVGVFGPLKTAVSSKLVELISTGVSRLQKIEWVEAYISAREKAFSIKNIQSGWRGAGLWPIDADKILCQLPPSTPPPPTPPPISELSNQQSIPLLDTQLLTSSPPDMTAVHAANKSLNQMVDKSNLNTPAKRYVHRLSHRFENLHAQHSISQQEVRNCKRVLSARKERTSGKRVILKNTIIASTEEIFQNIDEAERKTKARKKKRKATKKRKRHQDSESFSSELDDNDDEIEVDAPILYSEIEVEM